MKKHDQPFNESDFFFIKNHTPLLLTGGENTASDGRYVLYGIVQDFLIMLWFGMAYYGVTGLRFG